MLGKQSSISGSDGERELDGLFSQGFYNLLKPCHDLESKHSEQKPVGAVHTQAMSEGGVKSVGLEAPGEAASSFPPLLL